MKLTAYASLLIAPLTVAACSRTPEVTRAEPQAPLAVSTTTVSMTDLPSTFEAGGIVHARLTAVVAARVMATITEVRVRAGDRVRRGAPLVVLDAREMSAHRDQAIAAATAAQESSTAADADVAAAEANLVLARVTHDRLATLAAKKSATAQELDQAVAALHAAEAQLRSAQARRLAAQAGRDAAKAAGVAAETGLTYTTLSAPFDAIVSERAVDPGAMAAPGMPLLTLEDPGSFRLEVRIDESRAAHVQVGQNVDVTLEDEHADGAPAWTSARVSEIARLDPASHAFVVKIDLPADAAQRSGRFGRARFHGPARRALTLSEAAVVRRGQLAFVFAVDANSVARLRAVSTGAATDGVIEVLAGINDGERLVVNPPPALSDGRLVQAANQVARGESR